MNILSPKSIPLLALAFCAGISGHAFAQQPSPLEPIYTRQEAFVIPFSTAASEATTPLEVQLFVSIDSGQNWTHYHTVSPDQRRFAFQTRGDGEYCFATRTVAPGMPPSLASGRPELIVVVDTEMPQFDFHAAHAPGSPVRIQWSAVDQAIDQDSLVVQYREPGGRWNQVSVESSAESTQPSEIRGSSSWWPERRDAPVEIRAEIADRAGNVVVISRRLNQDATQEIARIPSVDAEPIHPRFQRPTFLRENSSSHGLGEITANQNQDVTSHLPLTEASGGWQPTAPRELSTRNRPIETTPARLTPRPQSYPPVPSRPEPAVGSHVPSSTMTNNSAPHLTGLPGGETPRMTNTRRFHLEYEINAVGPAGIGAAELWGTIDGGRTWSNWGSDPDQKSPFLVEVDDQQVYGFKIVVESASGLSGETPQPGDLADVWVGIDTTPPSARIIAARYGSGVETGQLKIEWQASDLYLAEGPVTLSLSERPEGPWSTIATGLPNSGAYRWQVDQAAPPEIYLRLDVLDAAGNIGVDKLDRPIALAGLRPQARINNVRPLPTD